MGSVTKTHFSSSQIDDSAIKLQHMKVLTHLNNQQHIKGALSFIIEYDRISSYNRYYECLFMRPYQVIVLSGLSSASITIGLILALSRFHGTVPSFPPFQSPEVPSSPVPSPSVALTPERATVQEFMSQYFEALNNHDFDTAYASLSPSWGVDRQDYQRYWRQFEVGSIKSNILAIAQSPSKTATVTINWSGDYAGAIVEIQFRCTLGATATTYRIDRCQQTVLRGTAPR